MLVYLRCDDWDRIMTQVTKEDIAEHLRERLEVCVWWGGRACGLIVGVPVGAAVGNAGGVCVGGRHAGWS